MLHAVIVIVALAVVGLVIYLKLRRNMSKQLFRPGRLKFRIAVLAVVSIALAVRSVGHPALCIGWIAGFIPGLVLGYWAFRLTRFETTAEGRFFTPNGGIGLAVTLVFIGRLLYRGIVLKTQMAIRGPAPALGQSALTYFAVELLAGYYFFYYLALLRPASPAQSASGPAG